MIDNIHERVLQLRVQMDDETSSGASNWYAMVRLLDLLLEYHEPKNKAGSPSEAVHDLRLSR